MLSIQKYLIVSTACLMLVSSQLPKIALCEDYGDYTFKELHEKLGKCKPGKEAGEIAKELMKRSEVLVALNDERLINFIPGNGNISLRDLRLLSPEDLEMFLDRLPENAREFVRERVEAENPDFIDDILKDSEFSLLPSSEKEAFKAPFIFVPENVENAPLVFLPPELDGIDIEELLADKDDVKIKLLPFPTVREQENIKFEYPIAEPLPLDALRVDPSYLSGGDVAKVSLLFIIGYSVWSFAENAVNLACIILIPVDKLEEWMSYSGRARSCKSDTISRSQF